MDFGAPKVYWRDGSSSSEEFDEDELERGLASDGEDEETRVDLLHRMSIKRKVRRKKNTTANRSAAHAKRQSTRRGNSNVLLLRLATLGDEACLATGDAHVCTCGAVLNHLSAVAEAGAEGASSTAVAAPSRVWTCAFCGTSTPVDIDDEERPRDAVVDFITAPPTAGGGEAAADARALTVFALDCSGSMGVSIPMEAGSMVRSKGYEAKMERLRALLRFGDGSDQFVRSADRHITYVSRMELVLAALETRVRAIAQSSPQSEVVSVLFSDEVRITSSGGGDEVTVAGTRLDDLDHLRRVGAALAPSSRPLADTVDAFVDKLWAVEESGCTALGPALTVALAVCTRNHARGTHLVVATDGLANKGVGSLDGGDAEAARNFYVALADEAARAGVTVHVLALADEQCRVEALGVLADRTGGHVQRVSQADLAKEFGACLAVPVIASQVRVEVSLQRGLCFLHEDDPAASEPVPVVRRELGNVTRESEVTFEFGKQRGGRARAAAAAADAMHFQARVHYTLPDGSERMRVITRALGVTNSRAEVEQSLNFGVVSTAVAQSVARLGIGGQYSDARGTIFAAQRMLQRSTTAPEQQDAFRHVMAQVENVLHNEEVDERNELGASWSDASSDGSCSGGEAAAPPPKRKGSLFRMFSRASSSAAAEEEEGEEEKKEKKTKKKKGRRKRKARERSARRGDESSAALYNLKKANTFSFL